MKASNEKRALCIEDFLSLSVVLLSVVFTFFARVLAGPGYTSAPNQGAMFVFGVLIAFIWPVIAFVLVWRIRRVSKSVGPFSIFIGGLSWIASCALPFWIGMD